MTVKHRLKLLSLSGMSILGMLSGQCLIYPAGAGPPGFSGPPSNPSPAPSTMNSPAASAATGAPALRFKKDDFVPVPDLAPMPLDEPQPAEKRPPLKVIIPNVNKVEQAKLPPAPAAPPPVRAVADMNTIAEPEPEKVAEPSEAPSEKSQRGFFGRLISHLDPTDDEPEEKPQPRVKPLANAEAQKHQQLAAQQALLPTHPKRNNFNEPQLPTGTFTSVPVGDVAAQDLTPPAKPAPTPLLAQNANVAAPVQLSRLAPAAGPTAPAPADPNAPLISLTDLPPDTAVAPLPARPQQAAKPAIPSVTAAAVPIPAPVAPPQATATSPAIAKPLEAAIVPPSLPPQAVLPPTPKPAAVSKPAATPAPQALVSPLWETQQDMPKSPLPPITPEKQLAEKPAPESSFPPPAPVKKAPGASALPPKPRIVAQPLDVPTNLPANIPAGAVQRWSGPDALASNETHTLPDALKPVYPPTPGPTYDASEPVQTAAAPPKTLPQPRMTTPLLPPETMQTADTTEPKRSLSEASKRIVRNLKPAPTPRSDTPANPVFIEHAKDLTGLDQKETAGAQHEAAGVKMEMKQPRINFDYELEKAYNALMGGQSDTAIGIYKRVLDNDPNNKNALFGLATTYHRAGQLEQARPIYSKLLTLAPGHTDALNNFLVLLADEAPEEALGELQQLMARNPQYSAIPAQIAVIYQKLNQYDKAGEYMFRAIEMAPENITYRYNFAIMLDKQHKYDEAAKLYKQLIQASQRGEKIPGNIQKIQQRLTFISSNKPS